MRRFILFEVSLFLESRKQHHSVSLGALLCLRMAGRKCIHWSRALVCWSASRSWSSMENNNNPCLCCCPSSFAGQECAMIPDDRDANKWPFCVVCVWLPIGLCAERANGRVEIFGSSFCSSMPSWRPPTLPAHSRDLLCSKGSAKMATTAEDWRRPDAQA